jgi:hypothetical protein
MLTPTIETKQEKVGFHDAFDTVSDTAERANNHVKGKVSINRQSSLFSFNFPDRVHRRHRKRFTYSGSSAPNLVASGKDLDPDSEYRMAGGGGLPSFDIATNHAMAEAIPLHQESFDNIICRGYCRSEFVELTCINKHCELCDRRGHDKVRFQVFRRSLNSVSKRSTNKLTPNGFRLLSSYR